MLRRLFSRGQMKAARNLGYISNAITPARQIYRDDELEKLDAYYENRQYADLAQWDQPTDANNQFLPIRQRQPRMRIAFAKTLSQRLAAKLIGQSVFPRLLITDSPEDQDFIDAVIRESRLKSELLEPTRRMLATGSCFFRFYLASGSLKTEWYHSKYAYPVFQPNGELESVTIKYLYPDSEDQTVLGEPKLKWFKLELGQYSEILYDNPDFQPDAKEEPDFQEVSRIDHNLGFVQGEWLADHQASADAHHPDGLGLTADLTEFIDELNYSLSQSSHAVAYNQDPQLTLSGMDEDETNSLIRSVSKSWNLGRGGKAEFLESNLAGVERAIELRDKIRLNIQDIARIVLLDPDKIVGSAQSAKAMEVLHGPMKDLIDELRDPMGRLVRNLVLKMAMAILMAARQGIDVPINLPPSYQPKSLDLEISWPPIFQQTMEDLQKKVQVATAAASGNLISRETMTRWLAKDFNVENVEEEIERIKAQPVINPFGGF